MDLIIFDCDGTLVDSEVTATKVFTSYWATHGIHITEDEFKEHFIGKGNDHPDVIEFFKKMPPHAVDEGDRLWDEALKNNLQPVQGMLELLAGLDTHLSVGSNSSLDHVHRSLKITGLDKFFGEKIFSAQNVPNSKPAADLFLHISKTLEVSPQNCIVIEDSPSGVMAAKNAGMKVVGFSGAAHFIPTLEDRLRKLIPDWFCSTTDELKTLLNRLKVR